MTAARSDLVAVIGGVIGQALADSEAAGLVVLDPGSPEGRLLIEIAGAAIGRDRVIEAVDSSGTETGPVEREEMQRMTARIMAREKGFVVAHPSNKTALLLSGNLPPERLLPLGDLYASEVATLMGSATLPADVQALADSSGGVEPLDAFLAAWLEGRRSLEDALVRLPDASRDVIAARLSAKRPERRWPRCVAKLGTRTLWIDVFE